LDLSFDRRFGGLHWRLTFFYTLVLAILFGLLGWFLDRQLWEFATVQLEERVAARSSALFGAEVAAPSAVKVPLSVARIAPPSPPTPAGSKPVATRSEPLPVLARRVANTDATGVTTMLLADDGSVAIPNPPSADWVAADTLSPAMLGAALADNRSIGPALVRTQSGSYVVLYRPVSAPGTRAAAQISAPLGKEVEELLLSFRLAFGVGMVVLVVAALVLGRPLASLALRPLRRLTSTVSTVSMDRLSERVAVPSANDDLRELALAFNQMLARLDHSAQVERRTQEQLRRFLGDASHELRSPLTALIGYDDLLLHHPDHVDAPYIAGRMRRELERMTRLVHDLLALTRMDAAPSESVSAEPVDLREVAGEVVESFARVAAPRRLSVCPTPPGEVWVAAQRDALERILENLMANAVQHTPENGHIEVRLDSTAGRARLCVIDDGEGIAPEHQPRVFDRFYRVDPSRSRDNGNAGLGLAIVQAVVAAYHGSVGVTSEPGRGSTFTVELPASGPAYATL
jgi:two-component system OmpR family sensor kinase